MISGGLFGQGIPSAVSGPISDQGSGLPDASIRFTAYPRAAMWILNRGIDEALVDPKGVTSVLAQGGGLWIRNIGLGCPGAHLQDTWEIDLDSGADDADGIIDPLLTIEELNARLGKQQINGIYTPVVTVNIVGSDDDPHLFAPCGTNFALFYIKGTRTNTPGLSGTLDTYDNWDADSKTICTFSWDDLPSTWTSGQFLSLPSLGDDVIVIAGQDIGSKTAVSCDAFDVVNWTPIAGDAVAFQGYTTNTLSGKISFAPDGEIVVIVQDLTLGQDDSLDLHWVQVDGTNSAQVTFVACTLYGVDTYNPKLCGAIGCYIVGWRNFGNDLVQSTIHDSVGGAIFRVHERGFSDIIDHVLLLDTASVDEGGTLLIEQDTASYGATQGWLVHGKARIDYAYWIEDSSVGGSVLQTTSGGIIKYVNAAKIGATGSTPTNLYKAGDTNSATLPAGDTNKLTGIIPI